MRLTISLGALILIGALKCLLLVVILHAVSRPDPEAEYWRGVYDVCLAQTHDRTFCLAQAAEFRAEYPERWYDAPSPGYEWPLPKAAPVQRGYPSEQAY